MPSEVIPKWSTVVQGTSRVFIVLWLIIVLVVIIHDEWKRRKGFMWKIVHKDAYEKLVNVSEVESQVGITD